MSASYTADSMLLCYVDHHDRPYQWAERRKLEIHPKTGAAQLVEIRETVEEIRVPAYVPGEEPAPAGTALLAGVAEDVLLGYGVPVEWLDDVRKADEDGLLSLADHLPSEAAEALLELATGVPPQVPVLPAPGMDSFEHPDAQRRFRIMTDRDELACALEYPWDKWTVFLHPVQRRVVEKDYNGPVRVSGTAGTGKTIVALHRAVHLARNHPDARVLLTTFSEMLADVDGNAEDRRGTISVFNGPSPDILVLDSVEAEVEAVGAWLKARNGEGLEPREIAVFVRLAGQVERARAAAHESGLPFDVLDERMETNPGSMSISTMHLAKGLEFRAVAVMACDDEVVPLQESIESVADDADLEEVYNTERHLLYVACTRARDHLLVTGVEPASEFLDDLRGEP